MKVLSDSFAATLRTLEQERVARIVPKLLVWIVGVAFGAAILVTFASGVPILPWLLAFGAFAFFAWVLHTRKDVALSFKQRILAPLVREIDPGLRYSPAGMPLEEFRAYQLFEPPDRYWTQDLVSGTAGRTGIRFAMVHAQKAVGSGKDKHFEHMFRGLLFVAQFNKGVRGTTRVASGEAGFLEELTQAHVELENPRFDDRFRVQSTDQVEARYILTPEMQERFVALGDEFEHIVAAFFEDKVAIALELDYTFFEPEIDSRFDFEQVRRLLSRLKLLVGIVDALDLNTRIWTVK